MPSTILITINYNSILSKNKTSNVQSVKSVEEKATQDDIFRIIKGFRSTFMDRELQNEKISSISPLTHCLVSHPGTA